MLLLDGRHRVVEELSLLNVLGKLGSSLSSLDAGDWGWVGRGTSLLDGDLVRGVESVGVVVDLALVDLVFTLSISNVVEDGANGLVDGDLGPVDTESRDLSVKVREARLRMVKSLASLR